MRSSLSILLIIALLLGLSALAEDPVASQGVFSYDDLTWVMRVDGIRTDDTQLLRMPLSSSYDPAVDTWLTASGVVSDMRADLDGDGRDDRFYVYVVSEPVIEQGGLYWTNEWHMAAVSRVDNAYRLTADVVIQLGAVGERGVRLLTDAVGRIHILAYAALDRPSGAPTIWATLYDYQGDAFVQTYTARVDVDAADADGLAALEEAGCTVAVEEGGLRVEGGDTVLSVKETVSNGLRSVQLMAKTTLEHGLPKKEEPATTPTENPTESVEEP
ncbi:MAG: hypothetical protein E7317_00015 [Clostridiales bacterium]|nr:hypothetical protein [Clostridiales bacterium]